MHIYTLWYRNIFSQVKFGIFSNATLIHISHDVFFTVALTVLTNLLGMFTSSTTRQLASLYIIICRFKIYEQMMRVNPKQMVHVYSKFFLNICLKLKILQTDMEWKYLKM